MNSKEESLKSSRELAIQNVILQILINLTEKVQQEDQNVIH